MFDLTGVKHHLAVSDIVEVLCRKTQNSDTSFFQAEMAYYLCKMAAAMRAHITTKDRGDMPVNCFAIALADSGYGKGHSVNIIEQQLMGGFRKRFMHDTMAVVAETNHWAIANDRAVRHNTDPQEEYDKVLKEYKMAGHYLFSFDKATEPAIKQLRNKLILAGVGSINLQVDEIGSNLTQSLEVLNVYLELYDQGLVKPKLIKESNDNKRGEDIEGKTPTNMLLFGTPSKLLDGGLTEDTFFSLLETGYARRSIFGFGTKKKRARMTKTAKEIFQDLINPSVNQSVDYWSKVFTELADPARFNWPLTVDDDVSIRLTEYRIHCEEQADELKEYQGTMKTELEHRYNKALKIAGAYAFVDASTEITMDHLMSAILLVEESGASFQKMLHRDKIHVRLGKHLADMNAPVTHHDLAEALPFYKGSAAYKSDLLSLATAWGYGNNVIIKRTMRDGIDFLRAETLKLTDLSKMKLSLSDNFAFDYESGEVKWEELGGYMNGEGLLHWCNHSFKKGHRLEENAIPGFNMIVLDMDGNVPLHVAHELLKEYKFMTYTTKRHTEAENRFRLIMPSNYILELDTEEYRDFMNNVMAWLPFGSDEGANQRARKWQTHEGAIVHYNDGKLLDALPFIPKTKKNEDFQKEYFKLESLDNLERWFATRMGTEGSGRNNQMIKYALALVDGGLDLSEITNQIIEFDKKLSDPIGEAELRRTVLVTVAKRIQQRAEG